MYLVVGLGNPGSEYAGTRHNIGFEVIDHLAARHRFDPSRSFKNAEVAKGRIAGEDVLLVKPLTYMNLSGDAVGAIARYYKVEAPQIIVVHDELDFVPGDVRLKIGGGHGGHNGLRSIMAHMGAEFVRVRMGIGKPSKSAQGADYVLSRFDTSSRRAMDDAIAAAAAAVDEVLAQGPAAAMNKINRRS